MWESNPGTIKYSPVLETSKYIIMIIVTGLESHTRCASWAHIVRLYVP